MFTVLRITAVPDHLRGFISRTLIECGTGLYVGNISARVASTLWERATTAATTGEIIMISSTAKNEQGFEIRLHQTATKKTICLDGLQLISHIPENAYTDLTIAAK